MSRLRAEELAVSMDPTRRVIGDDLSLRLCGDLLDLETGMSFRIVFCRGILG